MSVQIHVENVIKKYGDNVIIPNLSVDIENGELFTLLGPSGCGKTTLLRMIAGFNSIEGGQIKFNNDVINDLPAHKRNIGMVFQSYAIFPHLTVRQNVEYGMKMRKVKKTIMKKKVDDILHVVRIDTYQNRLPERLSGGQQQRVALARAIVIEPTVLLMDEPLSNLDAKLRIEMRSAIKDIQKKVGITTVYVTHDQEEALAISDRIAVMKDGVIQQVGKPFEIYLRPKNIFVASFIGHSNVFKATIEVLDKKVYVKFENGFKVEMTNLVDTVVNGQEVKVSVRPEEFTIGENGFKGTITSSTFLGKYVNYTVNFNQNIIEELEGNIEFTQDLNTFSKIFEVGGSIGLELNLNKINVYTADGQTSLIKGVN
ncbi:MAG: transporter ATP-binding protein [Clostridiales bacterium]|jgi:iron(III) transport system ATP-binding protein|nr:transporter ATP-binding protein [Clostridiales bacterium]